MKTILERFEEKFVIAPSGCWEWTACKNKGGYGKIQVDKRSKEAHRVSYELFKGTIPKGLHIMHICDNPSCVNPKHLISGTQTDNNRDCVSKGRWNSGNKSKIVCQKCGGAYTIYSYKGKDYRRCKPCKNKNNLLYYKRKKLTPI